jgi:hypothetical protein
MASISPTQSNAQAALRAFILGILPALPGGGGPAVFSGSIEGSALTVTEVMLGAILAGAPVLGAAPGTLIVEQTEGPAGGIGTYTVSISQIIGSPPSGANMATGVTVIAGQQNRAAEPVNPWFVVMTPISFRRLSTNVDEAQDCKFVASIADTEMTVTELDDGALAVGNQIFGPGVAAGTRVAAFDSGSGGIGTYDVAPPQTVASEIMSAGTKTMTQNVQVTIQCDFHSPDFIAGDFAQTVSTALRDEFGVNFFAGLAAPLNGVVPLYGDDPKQTPFVNAENAYEWRWVLDVELEVEQVVTVPQLYADSVIPTLFSVEAEFPPS